MIPKVTQAIMDRLDPLLVVRANDMEGVRKARAWLEAHGLRHVAPVYYHHPKSELSYAFNVTMYKGTRQMVLEEEELVTTTRDIQNTVYEFFKDYATVLTQTEKEAGYITAKELPYELNHNIVIYTKPDCIYCSYIKPLFVTYKRVYQTNIKLFDITKFDFPVNTPVLRQVPQIVIPQMPPEPLETVEDVVGILVKVGAVPINCQIGNWYARALQAALQEFNEQGSAYFKQISMLPDNPETKSLFDQRLDYEILTNTSGLEGCEEYLNYIVKSTREYKESAIA
ncbi:hypothetical protein GNI_040000 [Gregarina niphandrodes]|uniref:Glutaredoxin n=1 Tax=Gregarina niphandrodes TaxID=110365 RepID=A0A023BAE0_GRENI|nr:hypothetical protein GNI_040000 [Gregarina niphandrodes]EZG78200.1 hypothetical protein GNI_040000 [Gregarina niphandrodes]|eukprot:XP_011129420.1 hypothetical protein GNI_040000 [Gregarina niphandrodes]